MTAGGKIPGSTEEELSAWWQSGKAPWKRKTTAESYIVRWL